MNNLGKAAETRACIYLKLHGYKILERNYTGRFGEIYIIGSKNNEITFFEVKQRKNDSFGGGAAAVVTYGILTGQALEAAELNWATRILRAPIDLIQHMTTLEPHPQVMEVALCAFRAALGEIDEEVTDN